ncbi:hypothetical protein LJC37_05845 [Bacteroidales bacterium OttesenSCG-928-E04]|nr:hypothetical protein [Bacteroidales bacterium OttesenSCG-928-E04]
MRIISKKIIIVFIGLLITRCMPMVNMTEIRNNYSQIPKSSKIIDIPKYNDSTHGLNGLPYVYWNFCKQKERQLKLVNPETSSDSLIFRIWITNPVGSMGQPHGLIEIRYDSLKWNGNLTLMNVNFNSNNLAETITKYEIWELQPKKRTWEMIVDSLFKLKMVVVSDSEL